MCAEMPCRCCYGPVPAQAADLHSTQALSGSLHGVTIRQTHLTDSARLHSNR